MPCILLVEDDRNLRFGIAFNLKKEGHLVLEAGSAEEAEDLLQTKTPDLAIFDLMLPGKSGLELLASLKERASRFPVMMLTARSDESDAVAALSLGADDYVRKPFGLAELTARIAAILRRLNPAASTIASSGRKLVLGSTTIDFDNFRITSPQGSGALTNTEVELLSAFSERPNDVLRREELLERVWGLRGSSLTRTLDNHVARLRKKIEVDPAHPRHLLTVHGVGYKLVI